MLAINSSSFEKLYNILVSVYTGVQNMLKVCVKILAFASIFNTIFGVLYTGLRNAFSYSYYTVHYLKNTFYMNI